MSFTFEPIAMDRQHEYAGVLCQAQGAGSDYTFANIYGWAVHYGLEWAFSQGLAWIRQTKPETVYWAPVGNWAQIDWNHVDFPEKSMRFIRAPEAMVDSLRITLGDKVSMAENRDHFDYVYSVKDLANLSGNKFHKKKNLFNQFARNYEFEFERMTPECVEATLALQERWFKWHENGTYSPTLVAENEAIRRVLINFDRFERITGGSLYVNNEMVAYTVAEPMCPDTMVIHFEKGDTRFKGVYQAINKIFLERMGDVFTYVNREQDVGDPGLRKAKLSYNPIFFLKKYDVTLEL